MSAEIDEFLDVAAVCRAIGLKKSKVYALFRAGRIRSMRHPDARKRVTRRSWLTAYLNQEGHKS
jgi:hypothetical protein